MQQQYPHTNTTITNNDSDQFGSHFLHPAQTFSINPDHIPSPPTSPKSIPDTGVRDTTTDPLSPSYDATIVTISTTTSTMPSHPISPHPHNVGANTKNSNLNSNSRTNSRGKSSQKPLHVPSYPLTSSTISPLVLKYLSVRHIMRTKDEIEAQNRRKMMKYICFTVCIYALLRSTYSITESYISKNYFDTRVLLYMIAILVSSHAIRSISVSNDDDRGDTINTAGAMSRTRGKGGVVDFDMLNMDTNPGIQNNPIPINTSRKTLSKQIKPILFDKLATRGAISSAAETDSTSTISTTVDTADNLDSDDIDGSNFTSSSRLLTSHDIILPPSFIPDIDPITNRIIEITTQEAIDYVMRPEFSARRELSFDITAIQEPLEYTTAQLEEVALDMPPRFIESEGGDVERAKVRWADHLKWRKTHQVDTILQTPYPNFEKMRGYCAHFLHKRDNLGHFIYVERPGHLDLKSIKKLGLNEDDLQRHFMHSSEFMWRVLDRRDDAKSVTIIDLENLGFFNSTSNMPFVKKISKVLQSHYPVRSFKIVIVNVPSWFNTLWKLIKPLLHERTVQKTIICGGADDMRAQLLEVIDEDCLPKQYGGGCDCEARGCTNSDMELVYRNLVRHVNEIGENQ